MNDPAKEKFRLIFGICIFLAVMVWITFGQACGFDFVNLDDNRYVADNPTIVAGFTSHGIATAFNYHASDNWVPLTTISHLLDCQWYGLDAGKHHFTNVILHTITVILLFLALYRMTGAMWRSFFLSAVFAVHPLRAESVAWISERKDVLCGVFFMLTLWTYAGYVRNQRQWLWYLAAILSVALALMAKPAAVVLPLVLLLLDYWPFKRFAAATAATGEPAGRPGNLTVATRLILEKIPFLALSLAACVFTVLCERPGIVPATAYPIPVRIENAIVSYGIYLNQFVYPVNLRAFYFFTPQGPAFLEVLLALIFLMAVSLAAFHWRRRYPYFFVGWFWYLVVLVPVIGLVQVGIQAHADRDTYFSEVGLCLLLTWLAGDWLARLRLGNGVGFSVAAVVLAVLVACGHKQVSYWRNSETLWTRSLDCDPHDIRASYYLGDYFQEKNELDQAILQYENEIKNCPEFDGTYYRLGEIFEEKGELDKAIDQYRQAVKVSPNYAQAHYKLGDALLREGKTDEAVEQFEDGLNADPIDAELLGDTGAAVAVPDVTLAKLKSADSQMHYKLGMIFASQGRTDEALTQLQESLEIDPANARAHNDLGTILRRSGRLDDAIAEFQEALKIEPDYGPADYNLGNALFENGQMDEAMAAYQGALKSQPKDVTLQKDLAHMAWMLATYPDASLRNGPAAVELAQSINGLTGSNNPVVLRVLAAAYAECGSFSDAVAAGKQAQALAATQQDVTLSNALQKEIVLYESGAPVRSDPRETPTGSN